MPNAPLALCSESGCGNRTPSRYCEQHEKLHAHTYEKARWESSPLRYLYNGKRWQVTRLLVLRRDPICVDCERAASTEVHHVVKATEWVKQHNGNINSFYDLAILVGLCASCHNSRTAKGE